MIEAHKMPKICQFLNMQKRHCMRNFARERERVERVSAFDSKNRRALTFLIVSGFFVLAFFILPQEVHASATIHKGNAHVHFTDTLGTSSRKVTVSTSNSVDAHTDKAWEIAPGASQTLFINTATTGLAPPSMPSGDGSYCNVDIYYENGATPVQSFTNTDAGCPASVDLTSTTSDRAGVYRIRIRFRHCTLFALGNCTAFEYAEQDSDANMGTGDTDNHQGALRVGMDVSSITVSAYPAGSTFAYGTAGDETFTITANHTLPRAVANNENVRVNIRKTGVEKLGATQKADASGATT